MANNIRKHALLSASSGYRWISCTPSAKLNSELPDVTTDYAREGTCAHELAEYKVNKLLGIEADNPREKLDFYDSEMEECTDNYVQYISEEMAKYTESVVIVEQCLDFSRYVPDGFGTCDCVIIADNVLTVIDLKYGKGVEVSADHNTQMMMYAIGALELFEPLYDITEIKMVIFQPRLENISEFQMSVSELMDWAVNILKPTAELASKGEGDFKAGKHCKFCKVRATCRKRAEYSLTLAQYDFAVPDMLEDTEIEMILEKADQLKAWVDDVKEYALTQAISGKQWNGYKVVAGTSRRQYIDETKVAEAVKSVGKNPYGEPKVIGITEMTKLLGGSKKFTEILGKLVHKPQGKPTLVPISDKRPAWNTANEDFKEA